MIAINLIKNKYHQTQGPYPETAKRTVFLAPTRVLVEQHFKTLQKHINAKIARLHGDIVKDMTDEKATSYFSDFEIILFTPQVLQGKIL